MSEIPVEITQLSYEQAQAELEKIIMLLEGGQQALESAMMLYERGQSLARHCANLLDQAELKIRQITGDEVSDFTEE